MTSKKILITSGPTAVALDPMRVISNRSTGEMGRLLANAFSHMGYRVTLLESSAVTTAISLQRQVSQRKFYFYDELLLALKHELKKNYDAIIHAAAVSDFKPLTTQASKITSGKRWTLKLVPTEKLINTFKTVSPHTLLVGFKLETTLATRPQQRKIRSLFTQARCDAVLSNAYIDGRYQACLILPDGSRSTTFSSKANVVKALSSFIDKKNI